MIVLKCFHLNPSIGVHSSYQERRNYPKIRTLSIPGIRNYYNLVSDEKEKYNIKTKLTAEGKKQYNLLIAGVHGSVEASFSYSGPQIVKKKYVKVDKNIVKRELFFKRLSRKNSVFANINSNNTLIPTSPPNVTSISGKPPLCHDYHKDCTVKTRVLINEIEKMTLNEIKNELSKHGHKKTRIVSKRQRNKQESIIELKDHFKTFHLKK